MATCLFSRSAANVTKLFTRLCRSQTSIFGSSSCDFRCDKISAQADQQNRPRKPMNPYFTFLNEMREKVKRENPDLNYKDLLRVIGTLWMKLPEQTKKKYTDEYYIAREKYKLMDKEWWDGLSPSQRKDYVDKTNEASKKRSKNLLKKKLMQLGKPRKPLSAINYFFSEHYAKLNKENMHHNFSALAKIWQNMNEEERKPYYEMARKDFDRYTTEKLAWELKMMREGHGDLISRKG